MQEPRQLFVDFREKIPGVPTKDYREERLIYLTKLKEQGKLLMAGPFIDGSGGLFIFSTGSKEEAVALSNSDPLVANGVYKTNIKAWRVSTY
jgi:uncharacterized protein